MVVDGVVVGSGSVSVDGDVVVVVLSSVAASVVGVTVKAADGLGVVAIVESEAVIAVGATAVVVTFGCDELVGQTPSSQSRYTGLKYVPSGHISTAASPL
jgi:hypothetical protein